MRYAPDFVSKPYFSDKFHSPKDIRNKQHTYFSILHKFSVLRGVEVILTVPAVAVYINTEQDIKRGGLSSNSYKATNNDDITSDFITKIMTKKQQ